MVKNPSIAADWYKNAAGHGQTDAQNNLGLMYLTGKGVEQDHKTAAEWFEKAAQKNHAMAMNNLAGMYEVGWGVERNAEKAKELYQSAALTGNETAINNLKRLGEPVPRGAARKARERINASFGTSDSDELTTDEYTTDSQSRSLRSDDDPFGQDDDIITTDPNRPMTEAELERWLEEGDSDKATTHRPFNAAARIPSASCSGTGTGSISSAPGRGGNAATRRTVCAKACLPK